MDDIFGGRPLLLGPRVPMPPEARELPGLGSVIMGFNIPSRIIGRAAESSCAQANLCEKPVSTSSLTIPIALGVCIPLVGAIGVLLYFHRRNVKKLRKEDAMDPHKSLDFGLGDTGGAGGKSKRKSFLGREKDPQSRFQRQQMSMDMNLSSPYLLPPAMQNSRESLHSLARSLGNEDPYRPVAAYAASDAGSIRSMRRGPDAVSTYTRSSSRQDATRGMGSPVHSRPPPRQNSLPKSVSTVSSPEPVHAKLDAPIYEEPVLPLAAVTKDETAVAPPYSAAPYPEENEFPIGAAIQEPPAVAQKVARKPTASPAQPSPADSGVEIGYENFLDQEKHQSKDSTDSPRQTATGLGLVDPPESMRTSFRSSVSSDSMPTNQAQQRGPAVPTTGPIIEEPLEYYDYNFVDGQNTKEPQGLGVEERGRNMQRQSHLYDQQHRQSGLGVPQGDNRRLSVGFRPLPPDEIMDSEDPEYRANRIRSFYKEYFEDAKPGDMPPVPPMPAQHQREYQQNGGNQQRNNQYYEDYGENYNPDAPYFDPVTNSFVMPYSQPVARRAMTPPPSGQRFPGSRPPRNFHGSMGGMRMPVPGGPRPGSSVSNRFAGSRPGSSTSYGRSRAGSAMSGSRYGGAPKKPIPPPAALHTLPTPSKLKDDSFALMNPIDFAPPESFQSRARGRSQSPMGERRPYNPAVPAHSPLVNAHDQLATLPSPHLLRKSGTFTGLDFAPPRKFADNDTRSETGSIRSNRSGISAVQLGAIRNGAGRVSRLPGDTIFTTAAIGEKLKPSWNMRD